MATTSSKVARDGSSSDLTPRKTPRQERAEQTVALLIEAAAQVLEAEGLEGFNTNAVAQRAGVSIGSLYQYFPGKDAVILALMKREDATFFEEGEHALQQADGRAATRLYIAAAVRQQLARPRLARLIDVEEGRPELQRGMASARSVVGLLEKVLRREDLPRQPRPRVAARDVRAIIRGLTDSAGERGETNLADLRKRIEAAVFGYLEAMSATASLRNASKVAAKKGGRP